MSKEDFIFDFNRITYREILEMNIGGEDDKQVSEETLDLIARVLVSWSYDEEISRDAILDLGLVKFAALQLAFTDAMDSVFKKSD